MSSSKKPLQDLHDLLDLIADGDFSEGVRTQLNLILRDNLDLQIVYLEYLGLHAALAWDAVDRSTNMDRILAPGSTVSVPLVAKTAPRSRRLIPRVIAFAASLLLVGYFAALGGLLIWDRVHPRELQQDVAAQIFTDRFAKLISAKDCEWDVTSPPSIVGTWLSTNVMHLRKGIAELQFADGAQVILEGPTRFEARATGRGLLHVGKLTATVPQQATGFTIETPTATIVDLGTEFGVETNSQGATEIHVFKGKVVLRPEPKRGETSSSKPIILTEGTARRVETDRQNGTVLVREVAPTLDRFTRPSSSPRLVQSPQIRVEGAYASSTHPSLNVNDLINGQGFKEDRHCSAWVGAMWHTDLGHVKDEFLLFDLHRPHRLHSMKIWNFNDLRYARVGVKQADIYVSVTGKGDPVHAPKEWKLIVADQQLAPGTGKDDYDNPTTIPLDEVTARFVAIVIDDSFDHGPYANDKTPDVVGLSEVQFFGSRVDSPKLPIKLPTK